MADQLPTVFGDNGGREVVPVMQFGADGQPDTSGQQYWETEGTISAAGEFVELVCPGAASATVEVTGTFDGTLEAIGRAHSTGGLDGERLIFQTGVGSLGRNAVVASGTYDLEWRHVAGGYSIAIRASAWTSGSATIKISASQGNSTVFVLGPVRTSIEEALRAGRSFLAATPSFSVTSGNYFHVKLSNPANSGRNLFVYNRRFTNTGSNVLTYLAYANPTATPANSGVVPNLILGGPAAAATFSYEQNANATFLGGTGGSAEAIPPDGRVAQRRLEVMMPPGSSLGFTIAGQGGPVTSGTITSVIEFYEEAIA